MIQLTPTFCIGLPDYRTYERENREIQERKFTLMKKHGHNIYSEEHWQFFKEWYKKYYPQRKFYY